MLLRTVPPQICCILFDLGSTLWSKVEEPVRKALLQSAGARAVATLRELSPHPLILPTDDASWGVLLQEAIEDQIKASHRTLPDLEPDFDVLTMRALQKLGITYADRALGAAIYETLRVRSLEARALFPDTLHTLAVLKERGYVLGIVTNRHYGGDQFLDDLRQMGLVAFFDPRYLAISADLKHRKPHGALFQHALDGLGYPATAAAMVGDNLIADILGAQRLGMFTIWKPKPRLRATSRRHWRESSLLDGINPAEYPTEEAFLFAWAREQAYHYDPRIRGMDPPDAVIAQVGDLLTVFPAIDPGGTPDTQISGLSDIQNE
jgi:HAD superfamily hydrolase (TIGR01549 family)